MCCLCIGNHQKIHSQCTPWLLLLFLGWIWSDFSHLPIDRRKRQANICFVSHQVKYNNALHATYMQFLSVFYFDFLKRMLTLMRLSFASLAPGYLGTSRDHSHSRSLEADKSTDFPAGQGSQLSTSSSPHTTGELVKLRPISDPGPNNHHQATAATLYTFSAGRDVSMHKSCTITMSAPLLPGGWGYNW